MDTSELITWILGLIVIILTAAWGRAAHAISRNSRDTANIQGRLDAISDTVRHLETEVQTVHQRVSGVGRTADRIAGGMTQFNTTLTVIQEHLLQGSGKR